MRPGRRAVLDIALIAGALALLGLLPPDTSLADRHRQGVLRFCVPDAASPLVGTPERPGPELALMQGAARDLGLRLQLQTAPGMGRAFNPRDWQVGRGQCDVLGGGLANSATNRDFLTLIPNGQALGLVRLGPGELPARGSRIGVLVGWAGFDRVRLSSWLRAQGLQPAPLADAQKLADWLGRGGQAIAPLRTPVPPGIAVHDLPQTAAQATGLAFGLWRGDVTLTRALRQSINRQLLSDRAPEAKISAR